MANGIAPANSFTESVSNGTADPAESFTEFLENKVVPNPAPPRKRREAPASAAPVDGADEGESQAPEARQPRGERSEGQDDEADDPLRDPILDDDDDAEPDEGDSDDEADEGEGDEDGDDDDADDEPEFEVTVAGEKVTVKQSELLAGYSREADYRQKTQALAADREEVVQYATQTLEQAQRYEASIELYEDLINSLMPSEAEWNALKASYPQGYIAAQEQWAKYLGHVEKAKTERDTLTAEKQGHVSAQRTQFIKEENKKLLDALPQLNNPKRAKEFSAAIFAYGRKMKYTDDEIKANLIDHRDVQTAYYAARYLQILESRKAGKGKAAAKTPRTSQGTSTPRPIVTTRARKAPGGNGRVQREADARLQRTGSLQDAAGAFSAMFRD